MASESRTITCVTKATSYTYSNLSYDFHLGNGDNGNVYGIINYRDQAATRRLLTIRSTACSRPRTRKKFDIEKGKCPYGDTFHIFKADRAWGLWSEGGAMGTDDSGKRTFQLWPAKEYAALSEPSGTGAKQSEESP